MQDEIGSLEKGKKADLIALDLDEIGWAPFGGQDFYAALVYAVSGYHVRDVMVNGRWLYRNNEYQTLDYLEERQKLEVKHDELMQLINE
jgi:5-methylthioadenosine/S-adenosylhomocysteine deaminase